MKTKTEVTKAAHEFALADALLKADYAPWKIEEIIRIVNSHDDLVKALKDMREDWLTAFESDVNEGDEEAVRILEQTDAAITQAEGKQC